MTAVLVPVLPAASLNCAVSALLPVLRVTGLLVLQLPSSWTSAVPTAVAPSKMVTVAPALASARSTVPEIVCCAWLVGPPRFVIVTVGAVVSSVTLSAAVVELLPARSLNCAEIALLPSRPRSPAATARLPPAEPGVAARTRQADAARRHLGRGDGVGHRMRQRRAAEQQLDRIAGLVRGAERHGEARRRHIGEVVAVRDAGVRCRRQKRRAAAGRHRLQRDD